MLTDEHLSIIKADVREHGVCSLHTANMLFAHIDAISSPVTDVEVAAFVAKLNYAASLNARKAGSDFQRSDHLECEAADFITKLAAQMRSLTETNNRLEGRMCLVCGRPEPCKEAADACTFDPSPIDAARQFLARAETAERALAEAISSRDRARKAALEDAASLCSAQTANYRDRSNSWDCGMHDMSVRLAESIRSLAPQPAPGEA
jgi:hypothetical protein